MTANIDKALHFYNAAMAYVHERPNLLDEVHWQRSRHLADLEESDLLREAAWVILCSGFRESVVRRWFPYISLCFCDWESAGEIIQTKNECMQAAKAAINHPQKLAAIVTVATHVHAIGFSAFKQSLTVDPIIALQHFPFIGPITAQHLAKNIGVPVAKSDRHLWRLSTSLGFADAQDLCSTISAVCGEPVDVIDIVLWRFIAERGHLSH